MAGPSERDGTIRVTIQQPALPLYRVPLYAELNRRDEIEVTVVYGDSDGPPNVPPEGFVARMEHLREMRLGGQTALWHGTQLREASRRRCDVLVLSWNARYLSLPPALLKAKLMGVPTVLWGHGYSKAEAGWRKAGREGVAGLAKALLFYSKPTRDGYAKSGWDEQRLFVAPNALDHAPSAAAAAAWRDKPDELAKFKAEHGLDGGPVVLFVSRFEEANRLDLLIEAIDRLRAGGSAVKAAIVGKGEPEGARLRAMIEAKGLGDRVVMPGAIYGEEAIAPWMLSADVFCYPANIGLSLLHAMGYGLPVVTSDDVASQNPEIAALEDGRNGLLYRHDDAGALAEALGKLIGDRAERDRMAAEALATVEERFNIVRTADGMEAAIRYAAGVAGA
ncbi:MAG: glycosyltransferase family 4 protein [Planctomycetota bacterium]